MTTKIELTTLGSNDAQGCGDSCGCGSAKAEPVVAPIVVAPAACRCGNEASACCCADPSCC